MAKNVNQTEQEEWRQKTLCYVDAINTFVEKGHRDGWENVGDEPSDPAREHLVEAALKAIRDANTSGNLETLRDQWPPAHSPFINLLQ